MKRYIRAATKAQMKNYIVDRFVSSGCSNASIQKEGDGYFVVEVVLPNGRSTDVTVWVDKNKIKSGRRQITKTLGWDSTWTVDPDGTVHDSNGSVVGTAVVVQNTGVTKQQYRDSYLKKSARANSADVVIDHLKSTQGMQNLINDLQTRQHIIRT